MRSQIAFILCYGIVFRPAVDIASVLRTIASHLFQNDLSALIRCRFIQSGGILIVGGVLSYPSPSEMYQYWYLTASDTSPNVLLLFKKNVFCHSVTF